MRRNAEAVEALASACAAHGAGLVLISSNEVFNGERSDGLGYREDDSVDPRNAYGQSKLAGELAAQGVYGAKPGLWIVRTAWLYGAPGGDFPDRIVAAADRLPAPEPLPVVEDEVGSPTLATDLATAIVTLAERTDGGVFHLVNRGSISRLGWAERVLAACRPQRRLRPIPRHTYRRDSDPPPWAVLDGSKAASRASIRLRDWREACDAELERRAAAGSA